MARGAVWALRPAPLRRTLGADRAPWLPPPQVNMCTAYHRIARHVQDTRNPLDRWPPHQQQQLGGLLSRLNYALIPMVDQVQAQNLGGCFLWGGGGV